jgi:cytochrome c oxidase cbb3-type subunit 3
MTMESARRSVFAAVAKVAAGAIAVGMAGGLVSCSGHPPGDQASTGGAPSLYTAVGPVPGPVENPPRRENPFQSDRAALAEGRVLFERFNCVGCHGGRAGGGMGPSLRDRDWRYGGTPAQIFSSIAEGRDEGMPSWGSTVTEEQTWKLVAYVTSLRTPDEPNPPR